MKILKNNFLFDLWVNWFLFKSVFYVWFQNETKLAYVKHSIKIEIEEMLKKQGVYWYKKIANFRDLSALTHALTYIFSSYSLSLKSKKLRGFFGDPEIELFKKTNELNDVNALFVKYILGDVFKIGYNEYHFQSFKACLVQDSLGQYEVYIISVWLKQSLDLEYLISIDSHIHRYKRQYTKTVINNLKDVYFDFFEKNFNWKLINIADL